MNRLLTPQVKMTKITSMTPAQLDKLLEYVDAMFAAHSARDSSDGGLIEHSRLYDLRNELYSLLTKSP